MSPKPSDLEVRLRVPVLVGLAAAALLGLTLSVRARAAEPLPDRRPQAEARKGEAMPMVKEQVSSIVLKTPATAPAIATVVAAPAAPRPPLPPDEVAENVDLLQAWILGLSEPDLKAINDSGALNRHVAFVVEEISRRNSDVRESWRELDYFLSRLNIRLGVTTR